MSYRPFTRRTPVLFRNIQRQITTLIANRGWNSALFQFFEVVNNRYEIYVVNIFNNISFTIDTRRFSRVRGTSLLRWNLYKTNLLNSVFLNRSPLPTAVLNDIRQVFGTPQPSINAAKCIDLPNRSIKQINNNSATYLAESNGVLGVIPINYDLDYRLESSIIHGGSGIIFNPPSSNPNDNVGLRDFLDDVMVDSSGSYFTGGFYGYEAKYVSSLGKTFTLNPLGGVFHTYLGKTNTFGDLEWFVYGITFPYSYGSVNNIIKMDSDYIYMTGRCQKNSKFVSASGEIIEINSIYFITNYLAKISKSGKIEWIITYSSEWGIELKEMIIDNNNLYLMGQHEADIVFKSNTNGEDDIIININIDPYYETNYFMMKVDEDGNWFKLININNNKTNSYGNQTFLNTDSNNIYFSSLIKEGSSDGVQFIANNNTLAVRTNGQQKFLAKSDKFGNLDWVISYGNVDFEDRNINMHMDSTGAYLNGAFRNTAIFTSLVNTFTLVSYGNADIFLAKATTLGNWEWVISGGGSGIDRPGNMQVDSTSIYLSGRFQNTATFISLNNSFTLVANSTNNDDIFLAKADKLGNWEWVISGGSSGRDLPLNMQIDSTGIYLSGYYAGEGNFGQIGIGSYGLNDIFLAKATTLGDWEWVISGGGSSNDRPVNMEIDSTGIYLSGSFSNIAPFKLSTPFPTTSTGSDILFTLIGNGSSNIFLINVNTLGKVEWVINSSGNGSVIVNNYTPPTDNWKPLSHMKLDSHGVYLTGVFNSALTFNLIDKTYTITSVGGIDVFMLRIFREKLNVKPHIGIAKNNGSVSPGSLVENCFKDNQIIEGFSDLIPGANYYIDNNTGRLTTSTTALLYGIALTTTDMLLL